MSKGPWKDDQERRYKFFGLRLSESDRQALTRAAERAGVSDSELARRALTAVFTVLDGAPAKAAQS